MIIKRKDLLVLITLLLLIVTGCSNQQNVDTAKQQTAETISITDSIGRKVDIPAEVERIGCLYAFSGHVVAMLGRGDDIVAVVDGLKRDKLMTAMYASIKDALVPASSGSINIEELMKADPDLVFIKVETAQNEGEVEKLEKAKIPYLVVDYRNIEEQQYAIKMIGQAIGAEEKAQSYNEFYNQCIEKVQQVVSMIPLEDRVRVYHSVNEASRTDQQDTLPADWTQIAGIINVSVNEELKLVEEKHFASMEQILLWDPSVIIVNETGVVDYIKGNEQWAPITAVKNNKVYQMPVGISRWGHPGSLETPLAILWTAKTIYSGHFPELDLTQETKTFYQTFFNYQLDDDTVNQILNGKGMRLAKQQNN
jgi:iron complex transport system substrate-binding protein